MKYSRIGLYVPRKKKTRVSIATPKKKTDWMNIVLIIALVVIAVIFFLVK